MKPILFESTETSFTSNGLGRIDALSCQVTEARNGQFDLEMVVSIDDEHYGDIKEGRILYVRHDETQDKQPFDIYYISRPLDGKVTVLAQHVSYRTGKITVNPFTASSIALAFTQMKNQSIGNNPFSFWTDKVVSGTFNVTQPKTIRQLLAGEQGSILDVYGTGEYEWDKWTIKLHLHRGTDRGVVLRYGKDITELKKTTDISNIWTGVVPYWYGTPQSDSESEGESSSSEEVLVMLPEKSIMATNSSEFGNDMIVPLDMTSYFEDMPTEAQLRQAAQSYINNNSVSDIPTTIEFSFINLAALDEYKNVAALQRLKLCDTVTIIYDKLGVSNTKKIIQTVFDVLTEKYVSMTVGDTASNLSSTLTDGIKASVDQLKTDTQRSIATTRSKLETKFQQTITEQTDLITGGSGGNVVIKRDGDGKPTDILIMDNEDMNQALQILRLNVNGIGFSSNGINGPYESAWTLDGKFNADYIQTGELDAGLITTGTMIADRISGGVLSDLSGNNTWDLTTGAIDFATLSWTADHSSLSADGHLWCEGAEISGELKTTYHDYYDARTFWFHDGRLSGYGFKTQYARNTDDYSDTTGISENNIVRFDLDMQLGSNNSDSYVALEATNGAYIGLRSNEGIYGQSSNNYSDFGVHPRYVQVDTPTLNINAKTIHVSDSTYQGYGVTGGGWTYNSAGGAVTLYFVNGLLVDVGGATADNGWNFN